MDMSDYTFNVGDEVIDIYGEKGVITSICDCDRCKERGILEPTWETVDHHTYYITDYDARNKFSYYYKIGKYRFNKFDREKVESDVRLAETILAMYKKRLAVIDEIEKE